MFITEDCIKMLKTFKLNKSPVNDGLPIEFYLTFLDDVAEILMDSYEEALNTGELSVSQRQAIITLIDKPGKDKKLLKKCRL